VLRAPSTAVATISHALPRWCAWRRLGRPCLSPATGFYLAAVGGLFALASAFVPTWLVRRAGGIADEL
jgi:hypothetical protein